MDFKTRFQGKISHISKDGAFDTVIMTTAKMVPIGKTPLPNGMGNGGGVLNTGGVNTPHIQDINQSTPQSKHMMEPGSSSTKSYGGGAAINNNFSSVVGSGGTAVSLMQPQ
jgi:hypothetical protein